MKMKDVIKSEIKITKEYTKPLSKECDFHCSMGSGRIIFKETTESTFIDKMGNVNKFVYVWNFVSFVNPNRDFTCLIV